MEMERELVELFEAAKKAADAAAIDGAASGGPKVDRCIDVLSQLKNYSVTYDVLVSTQGSENGDGKGAGGVVRSGEEGGRNDRF
ncbi:Transcription elongation factor TFIIS [Camellia lanceoleosa]|uniref:Transcription elongation factor TFIIS n=1 Tax=Camellia lanceoleosa TaxID=1840588 RepID=A0ACC0G9Z4_9ERIC|nr:Transcription elongation factor TFIIS [Camellia lanceoleosa]